MTDYQARYIKNFIEENWSAFVESLTDNYGDDAEAEAECIVSSLDDIIG